MAPKTDPTPLVAGRVDASGYFPVWRRGRTPFYACPIEPRFSYCVYVPDDADPARQLVVVHGSDRSAESLREAFVDYADASGTTVISPLFPIGALDAEDEPAYKFVTGWDVRFDHVLVSMLDDARARFRLDDVRVAMFGFSGGAQFVERFLLIHPTRVSRVSIGSPGFVTLLDESMDWWSGTRDFTAVFGQPVDIAALREVEVQVLVGDGDEGTELITVAESSPLWVAGANSAGRTRHERAASLAANLKRHGVDVSYTTIPTTVHECSSAVIREVERFVDAGARA